MHCMLPFWYFKWIFNMEEKMTEDKIKEAAEKFAKETSKTIAYGAYSTFDDIVNGYVAGTYAEKQRRASKDGETMVAFAEWMCVKFKYTAFTPLDLYFKFIQETNNIKPTNNE